MIFVGIALAAFVAFVGIQGLVDALAATKPRIEYTQHVLLALGFVALFLLVFLADLRGYRNSREPSAAAMRIGKILLFSSLVALFAGPLILRPIVNAHLKSEGYVYCRDAGPSVMSNFLSQTWAKSEELCYTRVEK